MAVDLFNRHFDFPVLLAIREAFESGTWDGWMRAVTALGDHGAVWIALGVALLLFRRTRLTGAAILLALTLVALVGNMGLKPLFDRLRPCDIMGFTLLPACPPDPSFPSGHTAASFASAAVLWLRRSAFFRPALVLAALIAFSRLYLFVHFPTDVMAGILLGLCCAWGPRHSIMCLLEDGFGRQNAVLWPASSRQRGFAIQLKFHVSYK
ncbi:MAG: phosphatase PAP2 family protein [Sutterella wadsworthensis]|nr:phosphatase PAP2 family protein [Sutterella wadsworthensis]